MNVDKLAVCSNCGQKYRGYPALSRKDGETEICPDCGMREALVAAGVDPDRIEEAIVEVHRLQKGM